MASLVILPLFFYCLLTRFLLTIIIEGKCASRQSPTINCKEARLSEKATQKSSANSVSANKMQEQSLERMEALLRQSSMGIHILFDNDSIARVMKEPKEDKDYFSFDRMQKVQNVMTQLVTKPTYIDKISFLRDLDTESYELLVRTYFHIVENTIRAASDHSH